MNRSLFLIASAALSFATYLAAQDSPAPAVPRDRTAILMKAKLQAIHSISEGLVRKDLSGVEQAGVTLAALSAGNDWQHHGDSVYGDYRGELHRSSLKVAEMARTRNLEGATYGYIRLIASCIECHAHCRDVLRIADVPPTLRPVPGGDGGPVMR